MVVVVATFLPEILLTVADDITDDVSFVGTAATATCVTQVHDRTLIVLFWLDISFYLAEILLELADVVVPVHWGRHRISDIEAQH